MDGDANLQRPVEVCLHVAGDELTIAIDGRHTVLRHAHVGPLDPARCTVPHGRHGDPAETLVVLAGIDADLAFAVVRLLSPVLLAVILFCDAVGRVQPHVDAVLLRGALGCATGVPLHRRDGHLLGRYLVQFIAADEVERVRQQTDFLAGGLVELDLVETGLGALEHDRIIAGAVVIDAGLQANPRAVLHWAWDEVVAARHRVDQVLAHEEAAHLLAADQGVHQPTAILGGVEARRQVKRQVRPRVGVEPEIVGILGRVDGKRGLDGAVVRRVDHRIVGVTVQASAGRRVQENAGGGGDGGAAGRVMAPTVVPVELDPESPRSPKRPSRTPRLKPWPIA